MSVIVSLLLMLSFSTVFACEPPGCESYNADGYIDAREHQFQDWSHARNGTDVASVFDQFQKHDAFGERLRGDFTGDVDMHNSQYGLYEEDWSFGNGGSAEHYVQGFQESGTAAAIGENCDFLQIDADNSFDSAIRTYQDGNMMEASQGAYGNAFLDISGKPGSLSANIQGTYRAGYYQESPDSLSWQGGNVDMNINITREP